jgi:hypothetical protein
MDVFMPESVLLPATIKPIDGKYVVILVGHGYALSDYTGGKWSIEKMGDVQVKAFLSEPLPALPE